MNLSIQLDHLVGCEVFEKEFNNKMTKYIAFPIRENGISIFKDKYYFLHGWISPRRYANTSATHYLSLRFTVEDKDMYFMAKKLGWWNNQKKLGFIYAGDNKDQWQGGKKQKEIDLDKAFEREE